MYIFRIGNENRHATRKVGNTETDLYPLSTKPDTDILDKN